MDYKTVTSVGPDLNFFFFISVEFSVNNYSFVLISENVFASVVMSQI